MAAMNKWTPTTDLMSLRRMGKLAEELGELQAVAARVIIQGIDEVDPASGLTNRVRLEREIADVMAQCYVTTDALRLDPVLMGLRIQEKRRQMAEWESLFAAPPAGGPMTQAGPSKPWHVVLGVSNVATRDVIEAAYRREVMARHPDRGGTREQMDDLATAIAEARRLGRMS